MVRRSAVGLLRGGRSDVRVDAGNRDDGGLVLVAGRHREADPLDHVRVLRPLEVAPRGDAVRVDQQADGHALDLAGRTAVVEGLVDVEVTGRAVESRGALAAGVNARLEHGVEVLVAGVPGVGAAALGQVVDAEVDGAAERLLFVEGDGDDLIPLDAVRGCSRSCVAGELIETVGARPGGGDGDHQTGQYDKQRPLQQPRPPECCLH